MPLIEAKALIPCKNLIPSRKNKNKEQERWGISDCISINDSVHQDYIYTRKIKLTDLLSTN